MQKTRFVRQKTKGFTIIEVVLVLAIAGLIFMMVFVALPSLQRSQRNTQRRDDLSRFRVAIDNYRSHNKGLTPWQNIGVDAVDYMAASEKFVMRYIDSGATNYKVNPEIIGPGSGCSEEFTSPSGECYGVTALSVGGYPGDEYDITAILESDATLKANSHDTIFVVPGSVCSGIEGYATTAHKNDVATFVYLEGNSMICLD